MPEKYQDEKGKSVVSYVLFIFLLFSPATSYPSSDRSQPDGLIEIGINEKLGGIIPEDLSFHDESGKPVKLRTLINKPTILSLAYYNCSNLCDKISANIAVLLSRLQAEPGKDYSVLTISFDEKDTPSDAVQKKRDYIKAIGRPFPETGWRFLTGDSDNINRLTDSVGFKFQREGDGFKHPATLIILSPKGKVIRYLYGTTYLPFDVLMALTEASMERTGPTIPKALLFCYKYDPASRRYVFNILRITGIGIFLSASGFFVYLLRTGRNVR